MADISAIRTALAASVQSVTGLRTDGQARDAVTPPCAVILPGAPLMTYAVTMDGCVDINLAVLVIISDAAPAEMTQRALDTYLSTGEGVDPASSVASAIESNNTLGGLIDFIQSVTVGNYGRIEYSGVGYFGARISVIIGGK